MSDLYSVLFNLCKEHKITGYKMCKDVGIQPSIMTDLKMGRRKGVSAETADKIATYFGVSVGFLIGTEQKEKSLVKSGERSKDRDIRRIERARENMSAADKKKMMTLLELSFEDYFSSDYEDDDLNE